MYSLIEPETSNTTMTSAGVLFETGFSGAVIVKEILFVLFPLFVEDFVN
jgi:hypothetical protein